MISKSEIETFATKISEPNFEMANIEPLIGHLGEVEFKAVMHRAAEIARQRGREALADADSLEALLRLARAAVMPAGEKPIPWLAERGLIEASGRGWRFRAAKPSVV
jgi:hypothetical protein